MCSAKSPLKKYHKSAHVCLVINCRRDARTAGLILKHRPRRPRRQRHLHRHLQRGRGYFEAPLRRRTNGACISRCREAHPWRSCERILQSWTRDAHPSFSSSAASFHTAPSLRSHPLFSLRCFVGICRNGGSDRSEESRRESAALAFTSWPGGPCRRRRGRQSRTAHWAASEDLFATR